jgi:CheY-like chemotaxis protein
MGEMDGWQFRDELERDPKLSSIPIVLTTAQTDLSPSLLRGAPVLIKPFELGELSRLLDCYCGNPAT